MENLINFKKIELVAANKDEVKNMAPFFIQGDATQAYRNWKEKVGAVTDAAVKEFCVDYCNKKSKMAPGVGFMITLTPAVADKRERPYSIENVKNTKGKRKYVTTFQLVDDATGSILAEVDNTKMEAMEVGRKLYTEKDFKGSLTCKYSRRVVDGEAVAFKMSYTPSKGAHNGTYLVFGVEA